MTKKFKSLSLFLIIGLLISNFSCQVDEAIVEKENIDKKKDFIIKNLNNNEIIKNKKIATKLNNIKASIADIKSKTVYNSEFDFYIDTEQALYVESNDSLYHSYTFQINRTTPSNNLENLFLSLQADGSYKSYIVTYNITEQEKNQIYNNVQVNLENKVSYVEIDASSTTADIFSRVSNNCVWVITTWCGSSANHPGGYFENGEQCNAHMSSVDLYCPNSAGGNPLDNLGTDSNLGGSPGTGSGGGGNSNDPVTTPVYVKQPWEKVLECLGPNLSSESLAWLQEVGNKRTADQISSYLDENNCDANAKEFAEQFINNSKLSGLKLDLKKSLKSPANIDFSEIDSTSVEGQKFNCVYKKLMQSQSFKNLFDNTFGGNQTKLNVKFEIADNLPATKNGTTTLSTFNGNYKNTIRINKNILLGTHSNLSIAKTILHECIHAYLNIKNIDASLGSTIPELNNLDLQEIIGTFYQGFGGVLVGSTNQTQHAFIFDYMTPVMINILEQVKTDLISNSDINEMVTNPNAIFYNPITELNEPFNWDELFFNLVLSGLNYSEPFLNTIIPNELKLAKYEHYSQLAITNLTKTCN